MSDIKIVDVEGRWVGNPHAFTFVDPETGTRFSPGVLTKVSYGEGSWIASQISAGTLSEAADPMKVETPSKAADPMKVETPPKGPPKAHGKAEG